MNSIKMTAEIVRSECLKSALEAYEDAGISGLCAEGRWECAIQAIRALDLDTILKQSRLSDNQESTCLKQSTGNPIDKG